MSMQDPYGWLEDNTARRVSEWSAAQNAQARTVLAGLRSHHEIYPRLSQLWEPLMETGVARRHGRTFVLQRVGAMEQPVLMVRRAGRSDEILIDPVADGFPTRTIDWWYPSRSGRYVAYGVSEGGDEQSVLRLVDVDTGEEQPDVIPWTRQCSLAWTVDDGGFPYTRHPHPVGVDDTERYYHRQVFCHRLGTAFGDDQPIFGAGRSRTHMPELSLFPDGRQLLLTVHRSRPACDDELYLVDLETGETTPLTPNRAARYVVTCVGNKILACTNLRRRRGELVRIDPRHPDPADWVVVVPEDPGRVMMSIHAHGQDLWVHWLDRGASAVSLHGADGEPQGWVRWPMPGTVDTLVADDRRLLAVYETFTLPPRIYEVNREDSLDARLLTPSVPHASPAPGLESCRVTVAADDGAAVPVLLLQPKPTEADAAGDVAHPLHGSILLTGYGGMHVPSTPKYNPMFIEWCELGGTVAVAQVRGGGELGEEWHEGGRRGSKEQVFRDFAAVADHLGDHGRTSPGKVVIYGRSNGGLLVADAVLRNPGRYAGVACWVPLLDMLRFHRFLIGEIWTEEYGDPDNADEKVWLEAYSPYDRVKAGPYPPILFGVGTRDTRVHPMHSYKMVARLQAEAQGGPFLLRVESEAGHGAGRSLRQALNESADVVAFLTSCVKGSEMDPGMV